MASVNTFCRCSYKRQNRIFENNKTFRILNGRLDEGIFQKIMFHIRERKSSYCPGNI